MLKCRFIAPNLLEVVDEIYSFHDTQRNWWYFDTEKWLKSSRGMQGEQPTRPMSQSDIEWCQTHYIPKAQQEET